MLAVHLRRVLNSIPSERISSLYPIQSKGLVGLVGCIEISRAYASKKREGGDGAI